jgi:signal transduction histidine kinase
LTVVRGYLEKLADKSIDFFPELYLKLLKETRRLERLIQDIQELSQAEAVYLSNIPILITLAERFSAQILESGPIIKLDFSKDLPLVSGDRDRTEQILMNLLGNAILYPEKGLITVKA